MVIIQSRHFLVRSSSSISCLVQLLYLPVSLPSACLIPGQLAAVCAIDAVHARRSLWPVLSCSVAPAFLWLGSIEEFCTFSFKGEKLWRVK